MPKITLALHTASRDDFLLPQGLSSAIQAYVDCLNRQTMPANEFELVLVDAHWPANRAILDKAAPTFDIKYVPCVRDYWLRRNLVGIASAKNSALLFAEGELIVTCDDAELFPPHFLAKYWQHYQDGFCAHAFHKRLKSVQVQDARIRFPIEGEEVISDSRRESTKDGPFRHRRGSWLYAGTSFTLADALALNGFNERMDGCKSLEDCEFGARLEILGRSFVLDPDCFLWILEHPAVYTEFLRPVITKENFGFIVANRQTKQTRANDRALSAEELRIIDEQTMKFRKFAIDFDAPEVRVWVDYPSFNLAEERRRRLDEWHSGRYRQ